MNDLSSRSSPSSLNFLLNFLFWLKTNEASGSVSYGNAEECGSRCKELFELLVDSGTELRTFLLACLGV